MGTFSYFNSAEIAQNVLVYYENRVIMAAVS